jgi:hypothetical protein
MGHPTEQVRTLEEEERSRATVAPRLSSCNHMIRRLGWGRASDV